jgi:hypothetical protein
MAPLTQLSDQPIAAAYSQLFFHRFRFAGVKKNTQEKNVPVSIVFGTVFG